MDIDYGNTILNVSAELFRQYGIVSVSMDDVAHELHMSKKSIYVEYCSKSEIIVTLARVYFKLHKRQLVKKSGFTNSAEEFVYISKYCLDMFNEFSPKIVFDLKKKYPEVLSMFLEYKNTIIHEKVKNNFTNGIKESLYREEVNVEISSKVFVEQLQLAFDSLTFPKREYDSWRLLQEMMKNQFFGIAKPEVAQKYESRF